MKLYLQGRILISLEVCLSKQELILMKDQPNLESTTVICVMWAKERERFHVKKMLLFEFEK